MQYLFCQPCNIRFVLVFITGKKLCKEKEITVNRTPHSEWGLYLGVRQNNGIKEVAKFEFWFVAPEISDYYQLEK